MSKAKAKSKTEAIGLVLPFDDASFARSGAGKSGLDVRRLARSARQVSGRPRPTSRTREPRAAGRWRRGRLFLDTSFGEAKEVSRRQAEQCDSVSRKKSGRRQRVKANNDPPRPPML